MWWCFLTFIVIPPLPGGGGGILFYLCPSVRPSFLPSVQDIFRRIFSATIDGRNLIFGHKLHIGMPYRGKRFCTHQIPTSCLPTLLIFIHIEHICSYFVAFFSANIDGRNLIFRHKLHIGTPFCGKRFFDPSDSYFLFADLVGFYTHLTYMHIFRHIFLSNY